MRGEEEKSVEEQLAALIAPVNEHSQPRGDAFSRLAREIPNAFLNIKFFGYALAKRLAEELPVRENLMPQQAWLKSKASTQEDLESDWVAYWCSQLRIPVVYHRKIWENCYMLQAAWEHDKISPGIRALGFGCGVEPMPSYLASKGVDVTVTDLAPDDQRVAGWSKTGEHTAALDAAFHGDLVDRATFDQRVKLRYVDMNHIPGDLVDYDLCWSICALEHIGSIEKGLNFIENSLKTLKPGGVAIHTTEYNFMRDDYTIDNWGVVLFQRKHFIELSERLTAAGHRVMPLDLRVGSKPLDQFIDLPPFPHDLPEGIRQEWGSGVSHIKVSVDGIPCTCFGFIIIKGQG